jgi:hypothetical protein
MATAGDIITAAFIKVGVDNPSVGQTASALISLNNMIGMWGAQRLIYSVTTEGFTVSALDSEYTVGAGGQWSTVRPLGILSCYLRNSDDYDFPVKPISSRDYNNYSNKSYTARPTELYFLPEYPLAKIIFNTAPDTDYDAYFEFLKGFTEFATTATSVALPNEYKEALVYNLAVSLAEDWDRKIPQTVLVKAEKYKIDVATLLASQKLPPRARFDFYGHRRIVDGDYNIATDQINDYGVF